jgi:hypothetical protein
MHTCQFGRDFRQQYHFDGAYRPIMFNHALPDQSANQGTRQHVRGVVGIVVNARNANQGGNRVRRIFYPRIIVVAGDDRSKANA